jgi:hypothetical protein
MIVIVIVIVIVLHQPSAADAFIRFYVGEFV